ncbi:MAG TPA: helix-turn-helix transcriptional regulator [Aquella sp.]|nr:helix-turn-helix transcriptional regulator [Aquella sp.]
MSTKNTGNALAKLEKISGVKLSFGNMLWSIRKCEDITQTEFAKILGISSQHLCDIERGRKIVSPQLAAKYAAILKENQEQFVRLSIQSALDKAGLNYEVSLDIKAA